MPEPCPAFSEIGGGYEDGEVFDCDLPIEHNADGSWHEAHVLTDGREIIVRWENDEPTVCKWPIPKASREAQEAIRRMAERTIYMTELIDRLLPAIPTNTGTTVQFRRWAPLTLASGQNVIQ